MSTVPVECAPTRRSWSSRILDAVYRGRQEVLLIGVGIGLVEGVVEHERPMGLFEPRAWVVAAWALLLAGMLLRAWALGTVRKKDELATRGPYSLCRNPLYLGTILVYAAFCVWLFDDEFVYFGLAYFPIVYGLLVVREARELRSRFGDSFDAYRRSTPAFIPIGRFRAARYDWSAARRGAYSMLAGVAVMLAGLQAQHVLFSEARLGGGTPDELPSMVGHRREAPVAVTPRE